MKDHQVNMDVSSAYWNYLYYFQSINSCTYRFSILPSVNATNAVDPWYSAIVRYGGKVVTYNDDLLSYFNMLKGLLIFLVQHRASLCRIVGTIETKYSTAVCTYLLLIST